jgi:hypothetical protein
VSEKLKNLKLDLLLKELKLLDSEKDYIDEFTTYYSPVFMEELSNNGYVAQTPTGETNNHNIKNSQKNVIDVNDDDNNYIYVPQQRGRKSKIFINTAKTMEHDYTFIGEFSLPLTNLIREYIEHKNIEYGKFLFGKSKLSAFVSKINESVNVTGSINELRHMKSTEDSLAAPIKDRIQLAKRMMHSFATQEVTYVRRNIVG